MDDRDKKLIIHWLEAAEGHRCYFESNNGNMDDIHYYHGMVDGLSMVLKRLAGMDDADILKIKLRAERQARETQKVARTFWTEEAESMNAIEEYRAANPDQFPKDASSAFREVLNRIHEWSDAT